ncbi:MAG: Mut7-C RNAse domain-containing protein [Thermoplasmatota archaeon]
MRFVCDQMFGTLASWLRLLGFDTFYTIAKITDEELLTIASTEKRTLVTRDKELVYRARRKQIPVVYIDEKELNNQLKKVLEQTEVHIENQLVLTRCSICNGLLQPIEKNKVENMVPDHVFSCQEQFWQCMDCQKIYWRGTHYQKILSTIKKLKTEISS